MLGCEVRLEKPEDVEAIEVIVGDAFGDKRTPALLRSLRCSSAWRGLSFVATIGEQPVAHVAFTRGWLDAQDKLIEVLILSPVSVAPRFQRQGIGSALVKESITLLTEREEPAIFLEGDPRFYSRVGFRPATEAGFVRPSARIPERAFQFWPLSRFEPSMTGQIVYPEVFWEMDCVGLRP